MSFDPSKPVQVNYDGEWYDGVIVGHTGNYHIPTWFVEYRRRGGAWTWGGFGCDSIRNTPEPEWEPFTLDTFPPTNQVELRSVNGTTNIRGTVVWVSIDGLRAICYDGVRTELKTFADALNEFEIRINGGPWQKCGTKKS